MGTLDKFVRKGAELPDYTGADIVRRYETNVATLYAWNCTGAEGATISPTTYSNMPQLGNASASVTNNNVYQTVVNYSGGGYFISAAAPGISTSIVQGVKITIDGTAYEFTGTGALNPSYYHVNHGFQTSNKQDLFHTSATGTIGSWLAKYIIIGTGVRFNNSLLVEARHNSGGLSTYSASYVQDAWLET